ncbi:transposase, partial [Enterocloster bolteae]|nr:transposase [Enterocloster bolteae]
MKLSMTYRVRTKGFNHIFNETVRLYRQAVSFFVDVCLTEWDCVSAGQFQKERVNLVEALTIQTKQNPAVSYDFSAAFYKFPSYLRRAAIAEALGKASSYRSNLTNWEAAEPEKRGAKPSLPQTGFVYPAMYRSGMFIRTGMYQAAVKVFIRNTWGWVLVDLRKSDVDYIEHHCKNYKECVPTLQKRGKKWFLDFAFQTAVKLPDTDIRNTRILAVDLGLNSTCTCSIMTP